MNGPYKRNPYHPEHLIIKASSGNIVRSKSEALIDMVLYTNQIPFRYECELELGGEILYPDFTIRHPETGKIIYWEHYGRMDDPKYRKRALTTLDIYMSNGILPSDLLITTYETIEQPLQVSEIEKLVRDYFL